VTAQAKAGKAPHVWVVETRKSRICQWMATGWFRETRREARKMAMDMAAMNVHSARFRVRKYVRVQP
jgi:hypothetical protein